MDTEESPSSSSASDVDNLNMNNQSVGGDKGTCVDKRSLTDHPRPMSVVSNGFAVPPHLQQSFTRLLRDVMSSSLFLFVHHLKFETETLDL